VGVTLILAAVCALHPVAGVALGLAAACGVLASAATRGASPRTAALLLVAIGLAMVVLLPPLRMFAPSAASGAPAAGLAFSSRALVSVFLGGAVLWPCAALTLRRTGAGAVLPGTMLVVLVLGALVLRLEGDNQSKFLNLAFALASPFAAIGFAALKNPPGRARALLAFGLAAWLPTVAALGWAYAHERSTSADAPSSPPRVLLEMLSQESAPDAWVVDATLDPARGAAPAIPAITGRQLLWSGAFMAKKWGHPAQELARRESVARTLASGQWPTGEDAAWLDRSHHEIWLIAPITRVCDPATTTIVARAGDEQLVRFTRP
jgi:hypothetical protein